MLFFIKDDMLDRHFADSNNFETYLNAYFSNNIGQLLDFIEVTLFWWNLELSIYLALCYWNFYSKYDYRSYVTHPINHDSHAYISHQHHVSYLMSGGSLMCTIYRHYLDKDSWKSKVYDPMLRIWS